MCGEISFEIEDAEEPGQGKGALRAERGSMEPTCPWVPDSTHAPRRHDVRVDLLPTRNEGSPGPGAQSAARRWVLGHPQVCLLFSLVALPFILNRWI